VLNDHVGTRALQVEWRRNRDSLAAAALYWRRVVVGRVLYAKQLSPTLLSVHLSVCRSPVQHTGSLNSLYLSLRPLINMHNVLNHVSDRLSHLTGKRRKK